MSMTLALPITTKTHVDGAIRSHVLVARCALFPAVAAALDANDWDDTEQFPSADDIAAEMLAYSDDVWPLAMSAIGNKTDDVYELRASDMPRLRVALAPAIHQWLAKNGR